MKVIKNWFWKIERQKNQTAREICHHISMFYAEKNGWNVKKTNDEIGMLGITSIKIKKDKIEITLTRPGLLIGRRGDNINQLTAYMIEKTGYGIKIKEERILDSL